MKLAILSVWDAYYNEVAELTQPVRNEYAIRHRYHVIARQEEHGLKYWIKPHSINQELANWDWVVWMDVDTLITNLTIPLHNIITLATYTRYPISMPDLIFSYDSFGLNNGVLFVRNTEWSRRFVNDWATVGFKRYHNYPAQDQCALANMLYMEPKEKWCCLSQCHFNSYEHTKDSFILHLTGTDNEIRVEKLKEVLG